MISFRFMAVLTASVAAAVISAVPAAAQAAPPAGAPQAAPPPPAAGWNDGFFVQSANGDYRLLLGFVVQTDGRFSLDDPKPIINTFTIRKIRPIFVGRVAKYFDFKIMPDFGSGTTIILDGYFDIRFSPAFRIRSGKDKTPVGYELLVFDSYVLFPERALASSLVPNRDVGIQAQGDLVGGKLSYSGGVFNGVPDGTNSGTEPDTNNGKDLAGRITWRPFGAATGSGGVLNGLGFHMGGSTGKPTGTLPSFKTLVGQTYFSYVSSATANGKRNRITPAILYYHGPIGAYAEYIRSSQAIARAGLQTDFTNRAWEVTGSLVLTGEMATERGVRPKDNFDPANGKWGALQLLARYTELTVDQDAFTAGLAATGASREAKSFTVAANWYPTPYIKYYVTFERTLFDGNASGSRPAENVILFRTQVAF